MSATDRAPVVIVGASHAGVSAASELRAAGYAGPLMLVGAESILPYHRPQLSKECLVGEMREPAPIRPETFYSDRDIALRLGVEIDSIDRATGELTCVGGERIGYRSLILATGARARALPSAIDGAERAHLLRNSGDRRRFAHALRHATSLVVVGGGLIGLEVAATARARGLAVTVVEAGPRLMARSLYPEIAQRVLEHHRAAGVDVRLNSQVHAIRDDRVELSDRNAVAADVVLASVGSAPRVALASDAGLACDDGIVVDAFGRTSAGDILALGDCARWPEVGGTRRHESIAATAAQAKAVAAGLLGSAAPEIGPLKLWSNQGDLRVQMCGPVIESVSTRIEEVEGDGCVMRAYAGNRLAAVQALNAPWPFNAAIGEITRDIGTFADA
ncbi:FAD-dependent oxidoreductase [Oricola sp.]|uniref:NAD(P)/FAD-dependent oxidoreductase n=1 Tax=Oricola sp. TaxID=1979950 RepID=UPI0025EFC5BD|nr:FAD-dependent oxidoreductase [Oricola sp.]MCI5078266.1 FAD-dependent oxidoreductase [Oricola sp.]